MNKLLQKLSLLLLIGGNLNSFSQEGARVPLDVKYKKNIIAQAQSKNAASQQVAVTNCGTDTILYPYLKELTFTAPNDSFFIDAMVGNVRTATQGYANNAPLTIKGIQFWGGAYSAGSSPQTLQVRLILYSVNAAFQPTLSLDSTVITVTNNYDFYEGVFANTYTLNGNFAVGVKNVPNDTVAIITNNAGNNWTVPNYGEGLAWRRFGSGAWNSSLSFFGQDLEYMIFPIVTQTISSGFVASQTNVCPNTTITFSNTSTGTMNNRFYNLNTFEEYWNIAQADSTYRWNYGGTQWLTSLNGSNTFTASGTHTVVLASEMTGYYNTCHDSATATVFVKPSYNQSVTASVCAGSSYTFGSQSYSVAGIYTQTLTSPYTCDSVVTLNLNTNTVNTGVTASGINLIANVSGASYQWIDCANSNSIIPGATSQTYVATANGNYAVIVTENNCTDTSVCVAVTSVGLKNGSTQKFIFSMHPNPTSGSVEINCGIVADKIVVRDLLGRENMIVIPADKNVTLNLSELPVSVYFVTVISGSTSQTVKLVRK